LHLTLLNFRMFAQVHLSRLSNLLCMTSLPSSVLTAPHRLVGSCHKLAKGAFNPTGHVAYIDVKEYWSQYRSLKNATHHWSPTGHRAIDCNSLCVTVQTTPYPRSGPFIKSISLHFRDKNVMWESFACFARIQVDDIIYSSLIDQ